MSGLRAYAAGSVRVARRARLSGLRGHEERLVFVVGCPRSGTTFTGAALGSLPGFVDLDEVTPLKAALPRLASLPADDAARELRAIVERVRLLGLARGLRGVEQTPETSFVVRAALRAYPSAVAVHVLRDGRDVVCSLLERGWFRADRSGADDAGHAYGAHPRFWVEPERRDEFARVSEARRAAWAWRRYVSAARAGASVELRYESLVHDAEELLPEALGVPVADAFAGFHEESVGRWRKELSPEQLRDVEAEAGDLLGAVGYTLSP
jgi:sulfotransferase family protein